ncbi:hypothetical protein, partial [Bacillus pumilus]|uniref:hypothetical protein n=1 Tax=Bacillus pumilus TaxID=1408 RepID=UPI001C92E15A
SLRAAFEAVFPPLHLIKEHGFNSGWNPKCVPPPSAEVWVSLRLLRIDSTMPSQMRHKGFCPFYQSTPPTLKNNQPTPVHAKHPPPLGHYYEK